MTSLVTAQPFPVEPCPRRVAHGPEPDRGLPPGHRRRLEAPLVPGGAELVPGARQLIVPGAGNPDREPVLDSGMPVPIAEPDCPEPGKVDSRPAPVRLRPQPRTHGQPPTHRARHESEPGYRAELTPSARPRCNLVFWLFSRFF